MNIELHTHPFPRTDALVGALRSRVRRVFGRHGEHVRDVRIGLRDVNGPRGGRDKEARVQVRLHSGGELVATALHDDAYHATSTALRRALRALRRRLGRRRR